jgi:hypothetical protein
MYRNNECVNVGKFVVAKLSGCSCAYQLCGFVGSGGPRFEQKSNDTRFNNLYLFALQPIIRPPKLYSFFNARKLNFV